MNDLNNRMKAAGANSVLYSSLAQAFNYPDGSLAGALTDRQFLIGPEDMFPGKERDILKPLEAYKGADTDVLLLDLEKDYTRMFFASKPRIAYLFESVYSEGKLYQESTFQIARLYHEAGLKMDEAFKLPPDHIAVEFEFMAYLAFNEGEAMTRGDKENEEYARQLQERVLSEHLGPFALALGERISDNANNDFYRVMGRLLMLLFRNP
jgi:putative dimethyl sulfoxide reductase chaperone